MKNSVIVFLIVAVLFATFLFSQDKPVQKQIKPYELKQPAQFDSVLIGQQIQRESNLLKVEVQQLRSEVQELRVLTDQLLSRLNESEIQGQQLEELPDRSQYKSLVIPACAFVPNSSQTDFAFVTQEENQFMGALNNLMRTGESEFLAPVYLPHGARIKSLVMGFNDVQNTADFSPHIELKLIRRKLHRGLPGWSEMAVLRSQNIESYWDVVRTDDIKNPSVDNNDFGYLLKVKIKGRAEMTLVKILYED